MAGSAETAARTWDSFEVMGLLKSNVIQEVALVSEAAARDSQCIKVQDRRAKSAESGQDLQTCRL